MSTKPRTKLSTSFDLSKTSPVHVRRPKKSFVNSIYSGRDQTIKLAKSKKETFKKNKCLKKPFIPPPGKSSPGHPISWESKSHRLEINPPLSSTRCKTMHVDELSTTEAYMELFVQPCHSTVENKQSPANVDEEYREPQRYEKKISELLNDVSMNEREYLKSKTEEQLNASRYLIEEQENEIQTYRDNLSTSMRDFSKLQKSLEMKDKEIKKTRNETEELEYEKDSLMKKLLDVEDEGKEASRELNTLRNMCSRLKKNQKFSSKDIHLLSSQRDMLMDKLDDFEATNKNLMKLLRDTQKKQATDDHLSDRCDILMRKLTSAEAKIQDQAAQLVDQDRQIDKLIAQLESDKHQARVFGNVQEDLEATRGHLQNQLRKKEGECNRLSVIVNKIEHDFESQKAEVVQCQSLLAATRDKSIRDKDALKKATRIQKERAQKQEEENDVLQKQMNNLLIELDSSKNILQELTEAHNKLKEEKDFLEVEVHSLRTNIVDIGDTLELSSRIMKNDPVRIAEKLVSKVRNLRSVKVENDNLKDEIKTLEENLRSNDREFSFKIRSSDTEISKLRAALEESEGLTSDYKSQLNQYQKECDELHDRLRKQDDVMNSRLNQSMQEVNDVRTSLQSKILELEPYPGLLKTSEIRFQEARERCVSSEQRLKEYNRIIAELTQKVETQTEQLDRVRDKYRSKHDDCKQLDLQLHDMERQMQNVDGSQRELIQSLNRKDENLVALRERFDAQRIENERLIQQLEVALSDAKRQADSQKEKALAKERSTQARIMDLEAQLSKSTQNTQLLKRNKDEAESKFNSRLQDMRDRLEQANTTTRGMQSYVQFLKKTYANVFSDDLDVCEFHKD